jgi:cell wall-associated NlpC family hydrolase
MKLTLPYLLIPILLSCGEVPEEQPAAAPPVSNTAVANDSAGSAAPDPQTGINTGNTDPAKLVAFSQTLKGTPYKYASSNPAEGFDCSGFITYVFTHFGIQVPRSSVDFTHQGKPVEPGLSKPGDLILFTGTDSTVRTVGHMGIITQAGDNIVFIHATSGKAYAVTETTLNPYYMGRFVKVIRVFKD